MKFHLRCVKHDTGLEENPFLGETDEEGVWVIDFSDTICPEGDDDCHLTWQPELAGTPEEIGSVLIQQDPDDLNDLIEYLVHNRPKRCLHLGVFAPSDLKPGDTVHCHSCDTDVPIEEL